MLEKLLTKLLKLRVVLQNSMSFLEAIDFVGITLKALVDCTPEIVVPSEFSLGLLRCFLELLLDGNTAVYACESGFGREPVDHHALRFQEEEVSKLCRLLSAVDTLEDVLLRGAALLINGIVALLKHSLEEEDHLCNRLLKCSLRLDLVSVKRCFSNGESPLKELLSLLVLVLLCKHGCEILE